MMSAGPSLVPSSDYRLSLPWLSLQQPVTFKEYNLSPMKWSTQAPVQAFWETVTELTYKVVIWSIPDRL